MQLKEMKNPGLEKLNRYLKKLEKLATGDNNNVYFEAFAYEAADNNVLPEEGAREIIFQHNIAGLANNKNPKKSSITINDIKFNQISFGKMEIKLAKIIPELDGEYFGQNLRSKFNEKNNLLPLGKKDPAFDYAEVAAEYWQNVNDFVDYKTSIIWEVIFPDAIKNIIWDWDFIVYSPVQKMWVYLNGGGND